MSKFRLSARSRTRLAGVHPDLTAVIMRAIQLTPVDFGVSEGVRTLFAQRRLVARGASRTLNSRHLTGHAVDVFAWVDGAVSWRMRHYALIAAAVKQAAAERSVPVIWGGEWRTFPDGPHFELCRRAYPAEGGGPAVQPAPKKTSGRRPPASRGLCKRPSTEEIQRPERARNNP